MRALVAVLARGQTVSVPGTPGQGPLPAGPPPFDAVHVEHLRGACYGLAVRDAAPELPVVWDAVDCISRLFGQAAREAPTLRSRLITRLELARTQRYEGGLPARFARTAITSQADRDALQALAEAAHRPPAAPIAIVPNGVDTDYFAPPALGQAARDPATILFTGKLGYHANVAAAVHLVNHVMPRVWATRPDALVVLAGAEPAAAVRALADPAPVPGAQPHAATTPDTVSTPTPARVTVTGAVPDLRPYLHTATVAAVPLVYGVGIQNKVLEAMACAVPVVASRSAAAALTAQPGRDLLLGDTPDQLAAAIIALLDDPARAAAIGAAGRAYVEREHGWDRAVARFEGLYEAAAS